MKQIVRYKCDFCNKLRATIKGMERHEKQCMYNPNSINCYRCIHSWMGTGYRESWDGEYEVNNTPICKYTEDIINKNIAGDCDEYKIDTKWVYDKNEDGTNNDIER